MAIFVAKMNSWLSGGVKRIKKTFHGLVLHRWWEQIKWQIEPSLFMFLLTTMFSMGYQLLN